MTTIPNSWAAVPIVEVLEPNQNGKPFQQGWSPQCESHPASDDYWGVLKTTAIQPGFFWDHENKQLPEGMEPRPHIEVKAGDLLMTCAGPRSRCGVVCLVERTRSRLMMSGKMYRFRPNAQAMDARFLSYFIQSRDAQLAIDRMKTGISDSGLNLTHDRFATLAVPLAPPPEQRRIVAKIDELFSELDKGVESLTTAREQLKAYRQSVLKSAFEGKLTEDWRASNPGHEEASRALVASLLAREGAKTRTRSLSHENSLLTHLPEGWASFPIGNLFDVVSGGTPKGVEDVQGGDIPFYKISDMNNPGNERFMRGAKLSMTEAEARSLGLSIRPEGTVIFPKRGGAILTNKKRILSQPATFDLNTMGIVNSNHSILKQFLWWWIEGLDLSKIYDGSNVPQINNKNIEPLSFPICSTEEQREIVQRLDSKLMSCAVLEAEVDAGLTRATALRQSILNRAFSGQLVAQDAADEPASVLLERIRAEREGSGATKRRNNKHGSKEAA